MNKNDYISCMRNKYFREINYIISSEIAEIDEYKKLKEILALIKMLGVEGLEFRIMVYNRKRSSVFVVIEDDDMIRINGYFRSSVKSHESKVYDVDSVAEMIYDRIQCGDFEVYNDHVLISIDIC